VELAKTLNRGLVTALSHPAEQERRGRASSPPLQSVDLCQLEGEAHLHPLPEALLKLLGARLGAPSLFRGQLEVRLHDRPGAGCPGSESRCGVF